MAYWLQDLPLQARRGRRAAATAFALAVAGAWQPALLPGQIAEVEIVTTGTEASATATTASPAAATPAAARPADEPNAEEAAQKIVPAPGTILQSTENSSLDTNQAVAPAPSLVLNQDEMVLKEGETTESVAVRSGVELLKMLGVKKREEAPAAGLESDEEDAAGLFDVTAVKRLKGDDPTVVYRVVVEDKPLPDPMIVPWIRQAKLLQERFDKAVAMLSENRVNEGREELLGIMTDFPESDYAVQAKEIIKKLDELSQAEMPQPVVQQEAPETTITVELSPNVSVGTVIVDPSDSSGNRAMIGGRAYKIGDEIKGEVGHTVVGISENVVQVEVEQSGMKKTFDIPVRPTGVTN